MANVEFAMKHFRHLFFLVFLCLISTSVWASAWQVYNQQSGLPGNKATSFAISPKEMAVGTDQGVAVYEGETCLWKILPLPATVASCEIRDLAYDKNGNLWMATPNGLCHRQEDRFEVFDTRDGLPTVDVERLQIVKQEIYVGLFGGFVVKGAVGRNGRTSFSPINYDAQDPLAPKNIKSIGITGLAMREGASGWISTRGSGMVQIQGTSQHFIDANAGLSSDWVEAFWVFKGSDQSEQMLAATSNGLSLVKNSQVVGNISLPMEEKSWITSLASFRTQEDATRSAPPNTDDRKLAEFLKKRTIWLGIREDGLWRFEDSLWTHYDSTNSRLPSAGVNRLYAMDGRLFACTNGGLVIISLNSHKYDEFKNVGFGFPGFKTLYPNKVTSPIHFMAAGKDFWAATEHGLCRFVGASGMDLNMAGDATNLSSSEESPATGLSETEGISGLPTALGRERKWQVFCQEDGTLHSDKITSMIRDEAGALWLVFNKKHLARLKMVRQPANPDEPDQLVETASWTYMEGAGVPWPGDTPLTALWANGGQLYVGTEGQGYYVLDNPAYSQGDLREFSWRKYGIVEGLYDQKVIGFARQILPDGTNELAILHPEGLTFNDGEHFRSFSMGAVRKYSCIAGDSLGNIWMGSDGGLFRITATRSIKDYTRGNASFESNRISAIAVVAKPGAIAGSINPALWVACGDFPLANDQTPNSVPCGCPGRSHRRHAMEMDIDGASLHFFDGLIWDKWKVPGVLCMIADGDYLWMGTNIRLRRFAVGSW